MQINYGKKSTNYYSKKDESKAKAIEIVNYINEKFKKEVEDCIKNTKVYSNEFQLSKNENTNIYPCIELYDALTLDYMPNINNEKVGILNFASYKNPGGKFIEGSLAQEEYLCHNSILYPILSSDELKNFYEWNGKNLNRALYTNRALYSPNVTLFEYDKNVNILTCPAPNRGAFQRYNPTKLSENTITLKQRIKFVLDIFEENKDEVLILGAFGCGVFKQDPKEVAEIFKDELKNRNFNKVVFMIPNKQSANYMEFYNIFKEKIK